MSVRPKKYIYIYQFEALWPFAYIPCHDHCQNCHWRETEIVSQTQIENQSRLKFWEILRKIELKSLECPSKSNLDSESDLTTLCSRQIEPGGIIVSNFYSRKSFNTILVAEDPLYLHEIKFV